MFSKSKINEPGPKAADANKGAEAAKAAPAKTGAPAAKPPASVLSADLLITGNIKTTGDVNVEGQVEGDVRAHLLTVGEGATVKGEVVADDVVVNGAHFEGSVQRQDDPLATGAKKMPTGAAGETPKA